MIENKMDNELDFRVGDVVCDCNTGTGRVYEISPVSIWVKFENGVTDYYTLDGKSHQSHPHRSLYHGTWEQVFGNLPNLKPKRKVKRWVNLTEAGYWISYESEQDAKENAFGDIFIAVAVEIEVDE